MFDTRTLGAAAAYDRSGPTRLADRTREPVYEYTPEIEMAVNVALATGRPLLVRGPSGAGKSSLARAVAHRLGWRYYEQTVTSRTSAQDLLWTYDAVSRLNDAQDSRRDLKDPADYVKPGVLWWAFDRASALEFGTEEPGDPQPGSADSVVLIDEIDKAEPDVPNNLLLPVGSLMFYVTDARREVKAPPDHPPLIFITTNDERQLPAAFMRRCVILELKPPDAEQLKRIAAVHFGRREDGLYGVLADEIVGAFRKGERPEPNAAEYLDAVWACVSLGVQPQAAGEEPSPAWKAVREATLAKPKATGL